MCWYCRHAPAFVGVYGPPLRENCICRGSRIPAKAGESKERTFETSFVMALRQPHRRSSSPARTGNDGKRKMAKAQNDGTTSVQTALPIPGVVKREVASPKQVKPTAIRPKPRARRRVNKDLQRSFLVSPPESR